MLSVIIPIYNVEKYLSECIDSILNQTFSDLEIILVDDGSTDSSGKICDEYKKKDKRIIVIHKKNGGLSDARNYGLEKAKGDYILFIDSDDYIHPRAIELLYENARKYHSDITACKYTRDEKVINNLKIDGYSIDKIHTVKECAVFLRKTNVVVFNKPYKKEVLVGFRFAVGCFHEDEYIHRILYNSTSGVVINLPLYYYRQRSGSIMDTFNPKRVYDALDAFDDRISFSMENNWKEMIPLAFERYGRYCKDEYYIIKKQKDRKYKYLLRYIRKRLKKTIKNYGKREFKREYRYFSKGPLSYKFYLTMKSFKNKFFVILNKK